MKCKTTVRIWSAHVATALGLCLGVLCTTEAQAVDPADAATRPVAPKSRMFPASVRAQPGLACKLMPEGAAPSAGLPVFTDDDGYARFHALRLTAGSPNRRQILDCTDDNGKRSTFPVDLASEGTFASRPVDLAKERGKDRPPLSGDAFTYTQEELIQAGYGLRPDPAEDPAAYVSWLSSASKPGRMLEAKRIDGYKRDRLTFTQGPPWTGSVLTGVPPYVSIQGMAKVPTAIPGGDQTTNTLVSFWNGLGGFGSGSGLIQSGFTLFTTPTTASYGTWREYCCGDPNSNGYGGAFVPNPGDNIYIQNWYCDAQGKPSLNGGFGCSFLHDLTSAAILSCTSANGVPCWSVPALPLCSVNPVANCMTVGMSAEFILEHQSDQLQPPLIAFTDFTPTVRMTGSARSSGVAVVTPFGPRSQTVGSDPAVSVLTDYTNSGTRLDVRVGERDSTCFTIYPRRSLSRPKRPMDCPSTPVPSGIIDPSRREEIVAVILFGVIHDEGGVAIIGGKIVRIPPRGPVNETLAALPPALAERLSPLLRELPSDGDGANRLATQLTRVVASYRQQVLLKGRQP